MVRGARVGNYDNGTSISVARHCLEALLRFHGKRHSTRLWDLPARAVFRELYSKLYLDDDRSDEQIRADFDEYSRYQASPSGLDVFDGWLAFLIEDEVRGRFIWEDPSSNINEVSLPSGNFDSVITLFLQSFVS
jgi:hypothetical protein